MIEIRFHGRGGQGAVVASEILATALFKEGNFVQTFPEFGVERRGAPVQAFLRFASEPIKIRYKVYNPDHIVIFDKVLINQVPIFEGLKKGGWVLINTPSPPSDYKFPDYKVATVDATAIAIKYNLGPKTAPIVNTAMLGAILRILPLVQIETLEEGIREYIKKRSEDNILAMREAYHATKF
jgi:2-oxoacid:acceptor oxidoreductase gamma subunit (pyruvate/2-ketoisovalerate family)|uniref:Pyruvate ferredoxin oxidoreductase n=1 Tax=candidate division WOR-3 bacterium TaxID=2052148 RepID=A0A7C3YSP2_UNCW3